MRARHIKQFITENRDKKMIIFTETKQEAKDFEKETYARFLTLHGDLEQTQRENRLRKYREKDSRCILVATDVASRGLDIDDIDVVIQLGCRHVDSFVHRSGRTGRVGKSGLNIIFFEKDETRFILNLEDELNIKFEVTSELTTQDPEETKANVVKDFKKKALRKRVFDNQYLIDEIKETCFADESIEVQNQMLDFLLHNYLHSHLALPTKISFLTANPNL